MQAESECTRVVLNAGLKCRQPVIHSKQSESYIKLTAQDHGKMSSCVYVVGLLLLLSFGGKVMAEEFH